MEKFNPSDPEYKKVGKMESEEVKDSWPIPNVAPKNFDLYQDVSSGALVGELPPDHHEKVGKRKEFLTTTPENVALLMNRLEKQEDYSLSSEEVLLLIEEGQVDLVVKKLRRLRNLNSDVALKLIELGKQKEAADNMLFGGSFSHLNNDVALALIKSGQGSCLLNTETISHFENINQSEILLKITESGQLTGPEYCLNKGRQDVQFWKDIDSEVALKMIEAGRGDIVAYSLDLFRNIDENEISRKLIEEGRLAGLAEVLLAFKVKFSKDIVLKMIESGVTKNIRAGISKSRFEGVNSLEDLQPDLVEILERNKTNDMFILRIFNAKGEDRLLTSATLELKEVQEIRSMSNRRIEESAARVNF